MIASAFTYERATSVDDALAKLAASGGAAKLLAGGHSLIPLMKLRLTEPASLIDIAHIADLSGIVEDRGALVVGAGTVHHDVATSALLRARCPVVAETAGAIGDAQVRNRGTIGGSLAHADPAADYPAALLAVGAELSLNSTRGTRVVAAADFFQDLFTVDLGVDEIITAVRFPAVRTAAYAKLHQRASRFAVVGVAAALEAVAGTIHAARIGLTGAVSHPVRLRPVEEALVGREASMDACADAAGSAGTELENVASDIHASEAYRRAMIPVLARRALAAALARE